MNGHADPVRAAEDEVGSLRRELGSLVSELDRRRQEAFDLRLQVRRHPVILVTVAAGAAILVGGVVAALLRSRRRQSIPRRAREVRRALTRIVRRPERVAVEPRIGEKIAAAAATAAAAALARRFVQRAVKAQGRYPAAAERPAS